MKSEVIVIKHYLRRRLNQRLERQFQRWNDQQQQPQQRQLCPPVPPVLPFQSGCFERNARNIHIREIMESIQRLQKKKEKYNQRITI